MIQDQTKANIFEWTCVCKRLEKKALRYVSLTMAAGTNKSKKKGLLFWDFPGSEESA